MKAFNLSDIELTKYLFFTGKGGVGKTSIACATAVGLADKGKKILLISTDPASNLQDVFDQSLNGHGTAISEVPGLTVVNLDPEQAAAEYRESVIAPFRGKLPESVIQNMEEQLSGSCTVEIAAFNEFSDFITDAVKAKEYDHIIFDTAPTGHTLRMLQLPSAWSTFISERCGNPFAGRGRLRQNRQDNHLPDKTRIGRCPPDTNKTPAPGEGCRRIRMPGRVIPAPCVCGRRA